MCVCVCVFICVCACVCQSLWVSVRAYVSTRSELARNERSGWLVTEIWIRGQLASRVTMHSEVTFLWWRCIKAFCVADKRAARKTNRITTVTTTTTTNNNNNKPTHNLCHYCFRNEVSTFSFFHINYNIEWGIVLMISILASRKVVYVQFRNFHNTSTIPVKNTRLFTYYDINLGLEYSNCPRGYITDIVKEEYKKCNG